MNNVVLIKGISIGIVLNYSLENTKNIINKISELFRGINTEIIILKENDFIYNEELNNCSNKIYEYSEENDNTTIKDILIKKSNYEWILLLESDDIINEFNKKRFFEIIAKNEVKNYKIEVINHNVVEAKNFPYSLEMTRVFHKDAIEEELLDCLIIKKKNYLQEIDLKVRDYLFNKKIKVLAKEQQEDNENPYRFFQLALAYKMNGDNEKTKEYFLKAMELPFNPDKGYIQVMIIMYGNLLLEMEEYGEALLLENLYEYFEGIADYLCLLGRIYLKTGFLKEAIREFSKALNTFAYISEGQNSYIPNYYMGCIYEVAGDIEIAKKLYGRCGEYRPAKERLKEIL